MHAQADRAVTAGIGFGLLGIWRNVYLPARARGRRRHVGRRATWHGLWSYVSAAAYAQNMPATASHRGSVSRSTTPAI